MASASSPGLNDVPPEETVPREAVDALNQASKRLRELGHTLLVVADGMLIRLHPDGTHEVVRRVKPRIRVSERVRAIKR